MHSSYVKGPKIKAILEEENLECEQKLQKITSLLDGSDVSKEKSESGLKLVEPSETGIGGGGGGGGGEGAGQPESGGGFDAVLNDLSPGDRKNGAELLELIERNASIDWDRNSFEIILSGEKINFSDLRLLIKKTVVPLPVSQPIGLTLFIDKLIDLKTPLNYFKSGDSRAIRSQLLKIRQGEPGGGEVRQGEPSGGEKEAVDEVEPGSVLPDQKNEKRKREEEVDVEEEGVEPSVKRPKIDTDVVKDSFDVQPAQLDRLRRSGRLRQDIVDTWKEEQEKSSTQKKTGKKDGRKRKK